MEETRYESEVDDNGVDDDEECWTKREVNKRGREVVKPVAGYCAVTQTKTTQPLPRESSFEAGRFLRSLAKRERERERVEENCG